MSPYRCERQIVGGVMRWSRSQEIELQADAAVEREASAPGSAPALAAASTPELIRALAARDVECIPAGAWERVVGDLEAQVIALEVQLGEAELAGRAKVAEAVTLGMHALDDKRQAEQEVSNLAQAIIGPDIAAFEHGFAEEND